MRKHANRKQTPSLFFLLFLLLSACTTACGRGEKNGGYYVIETESEQIFAQSQDNSDVFLLGSLFYKNEPVMLAGYRHRDQETGGKYVDVCLRHTSGEDETLWENLPEEHGYGRWYLDENGNGYCLYMNQIIRYDRGGGERYRNAYEGITRFTGACMPEKGDFLLLGLTQQGMSNLLSLDPETGDIAQTGVTLAVEYEGTQGRLAIAGDGDEFLVLDSSGIWEADSSKGRNDCIMPFDGGMYTPSEVSDFRIMRDGTAQVLRGNVLDTVRRMDISRERKVLTLRVPNKINDSFITMGWLPAAITRFNKENGEYYVAVEAPEGDEGTFDICERTGMELALGQGPDMMLNMLYDSQSFVVKGALEDLTPWMEASGIREEDYFPAAFEGLRGYGAEGEGSGIYGINIMLLPTPGMWVSQELFPEGLGSGLDAEKLISALEAYEGDAAYTRTSSGLMDDLMLASGSLCGTVDWEKKSCDFTGSMFKRILEICRRYASPAGRSTEALSGTISDALYIYANIYGNEDEMAARGWMTVGCLFDDGCHPGIDTKTQMTMNSASPYKEGAWEFIHFLLSEETQSAISWLDNDFIYPSSRKAFETLAAKEIAEGSPWPDVTLADGSTVKGALMGKYWSESSLPLEQRLTHFSLTEEKISKVRKMLEDAQAYPLCTKPIRTIIDEEASAYFAGDRNIDDVCANIQNRVQLYLSEQE